MFINGILSPITVEGVFPSHFSIAFSWASILLSSNNWSVISCFCNFKDSASAFASVIFFSASTFVFSNSCWAFLTSCSAICFASIALLYSSLLFYLIIFSSEITIPYFSFFAFISSFICLDTSLRLVTNSSAV